MTNLEIFIAERGNDGDIKISPEVTLMRKIFDKCLSLFEDFMNESMQFKDFKNGKLGDSCEARVSENGVYELIFKDGDKEILHSYVDENMPKLSENVMNDVITDDMMQHSNYIAKIFSEWLNKNGKKYSSDEETLNKNFESIIKDSSFLNTLIEESSYLPYYDIWINEKIVSKYPSIMSFYKHMPLQFHKIYETYVILMCNDKLDILEDVNDSLIKVKESLKTNGFKAVDFTKHFGKYVSGVLNDLVSGKDIVTVISKDGVTNVAFSINDLSDEAKEKIAEFKSRYDADPNDPSLTVESFNKIFSDDMNKGNNALKSKLNGKKNVWQNIFKGVYSGYANGLSSKNRGNEFEEEFIKNYESTYENQVKNLLKYEKLAGNENVPAIEHVGGKNCRRTLAIDNGKAWLVTKENGDSLNIGKSIADVVLHAFYKVASSSDKFFQYDTYVSLKYGNTIAFANTGIQKVFTKSMFERGEVNDKAQQLFDMFGIDKDKFLNVFNSYNKGNAGNYEIEDVTAKLDEKKKDDIFRFIQYNIGYGYIIVYNKEKVNEIVNVLTKDDLDTLIGNENEHPVSKVLIKYPENGSKKRVEILIYLKIGKIFRFTIRSKDGSVYPTHIMSDFI